MKIRLPDEVKIFTATDNGHSFRGDGCVRLDDVILCSRVENGALTVSVSADTTPRFHVRFRWNFREDEKRRGVRILGDSWERSYGELEWRGAVPHRFMPWYILVSNGSDATPDTSDRFTECFGVDVRPAAMCTWQYDTSGVTLWMDVRCGGDGVILAGRQLEVCRIRMEEYRDCLAFDAGKKFCREMCPDGLISKKPIYGFNNWYYAVGESSHEEFLRGARLMASLSEGLENRPYAVVDDGWQKHPCDGPWNITRESFHDMERLAADIAETGCIPGIWIRPLLNTTRTGVTDDMFLTCRPEVLDPSLPSVIEYVKDSIKQIKAWGYKLLKHDFTSFDIFGRDGFSNPKYLADNGWSFADRSRTSAEITLDLYRAILDAAGDDMTVLACCTPSHLTAGLAQIMRTGFDTSSRHFERTRLSGVNTLAFRLMQNGIFYTVDADCVCHAGRIDWALNREWLKLVADSGTALFLSTDPDLTGEEHLRDMLPAVALAAAGGRSMRPVDWMENQDPDEYFADGESFTYRWYAEEGTRQFIPPTEQIY